MYLSRQPTADSRQPTADSRQPTEDNARPLPAQPVPAAPVAAPAAAAAKKEVPIVFCADANYGLYLPVAVQSIIENSSANYHYSIIVFDCGIKREAIDALQRQIRPLANFSLHVKNIEAWLEKHKNAFSGNNYLSSATYGRFAIPDLCKGYEKVIYADIDMVFNKDVAELVKIDLGENYIGGVLDVAIEGESATRKTYSEYMKNDLGITRPLSYVNAGLLILNVSAWKKHNLVDKIIKFLNKKKLKLLDQDAINSICNGRIYFIDSSWNCTVLAEWVLREKYFILRAKQLVDLQKAADKFYDSFYGDCFGCHYTGSYKPWHGWDSPKCNLWWGYAAKTPLYALYINDMVKKENFVDIRTLITDPVIYTYSFLGIPLWIVKQSRYGKRYCLGSLRLAKTKQGRESIYVYILGIKFFSIKKKKP